MTARIPLLSLLTAACAAGAPSVPAGEGSGGEAVAEAPPAVRLERRHAAASHYEARMEAWLSNSGAGAPVRFESVATHEAGPREDGPREDGPGGDGPGGDGESLVLTRFAPLVVRDAEREVDPLPGDLRDLEGVRMEHAVDARNRVVSGPTFEGSGPSASFLDELADVVRHVRAVFPEGEVRPGDRWEGDPITWDTRPLGWVVLEWRPTFELERVEAGVARIRWRGEVRVHPFRMMGMSLEGVGEIFGITEVALDDGFAGRTDLDIDVGLRPAGASIPPPFRVRAKYVETVRRLP